MTHLAAVLSMSLYIVSAVLCFVRFWRPSKAGRTVKFGVSCVFLALVLHTLTLGLVLRDSRFFALENGADYFLSVSWLLGVALFVFRKWFHYPLLGAFISSAIVLFMGSSSYLLHQDTVSLVGGSPDIQRQDLIISLLHGVPALIAVVSLVLALGVSIAFLVVENRLKKRKLLALDGSGISLQQLDRLNSFLAKIGFIAISLVIVSGGLWAVLERKAVFTADTSVVSGIVVWLLLAAILFARVVLRWSPRRISRLTLWVTGAFIFSVFIVLAVSGRMTHAALWS
jgi:ABC-type transport system involved in cytochrome c biogenesis permease subunit